MSAWKQDEWVKQIAWPWLVPNGGVGRLKGWGQFLGAGRPLCGGLWIARRKTEPLEEGCPGKGVVRNTVPSEVLRV